MIWNIPCRIGDTVWVIRSRADKKIISRGTVSEISFIGVKMDLCIVVGHLLRGRWGINVFHSEQDAKEALEREKDPQFVSAAQVRTMTLDEVRERKDDILASLPKW